MLSYAGVSLSLAQLGADPGGELGPDFLVEAAARSWPGHELGQLGFEAALPALPHALGVLHWPRGASRFACGHYLVSTGQLEAIRAAVYSTGALEPKTLVIDDGAHQVSTSLYMLPARPLGRAHRATPGCHLLTLVDVRYYWWFQAASITVSEGQTTWADLFGQLAQALGVGFAQDAIPAAYLQPGAGLAARYRALPLLLDAACASVGQRLVRRLDGSVCLLSPASSQTAYEDNRALAPRCWGDQYDLDLAEGSHDLPAAVPASVTVAFPVYTNGQKTGAKHAVTVSLAALGIAGLAGVSGFAGSKVMNSSAAALVPSAGGAPSNAGELQSLAEQAARDWYGYRVARPATRYIGAVNWQMEGLTDCVLFEHPDQAVATRCVRGPWLEHLEDLHHFTPVAASGSGAGSGSGPAAGDCTATVYNLECIGGKLKKYEAKITLVDGCLVQTPWRYVGDEGCCECSGSGTGSAAGSGTGAGGVLGCCPTAGPFATIYVTFYGGTGTCNCFDGQSASLAWNGLDGWVGGINACGGSIGIRVGINCELALSGHCSALKLFVPSSCFPFTASATITTGVGCCAGDVSFTLSE